MSSARWRAIEVARFEQEHEAAHRCIVRGHEERSGL
jgi:hypothetical protein